MSIDYYDMEQFPERQLDKVLIPKLSDEDQNKLDEIKNKLDEIISDKNMKVLKDKKKKKKKNQMKNQIKIIRTAHEITKNEENQKLEKAQEKLQNALVNISYTNDLKMYVQFQNLVVLKNKLIERVKSMENRKKPTLKDAEKIIKSSRARIARRKLATARRNNQQKKEKKNNEADGETKYQIKLRF